MARVAPFFVARVLTMKMYTYAKCDTCRKATKWLRDKGFDFEEIPIRETPPSPAELRKMLAIYQGDLRRLFNTSGQDYRALGMKDKLPTLSEDEAIALLAEVFTEIGIEPRASEQQP